MAADATIGAEDQNELVIALVAAVGTDVGMVAEELAIDLDEYSYQTERLRLSNYLAEEFGTDFFADEKFDTAVWEAMSAGDTLRNEWGRGDALALHAISDIVAIRSERAGAGGDPCATCGAEQPGPGLDRFAFILRSLKTQAELETLRAVYGPRLVVIAAYSPKEDRIAHLETQIEASRKTHDREKWEYTPEALVERDEKEERERGQDVSGTFHQADFFIRAWDRDVARADIQRTFEILFGSPFRTPTRDEQGQFLAAGAALRSAELSRQVGAALTTPGGSVIAVGANEVPTYGGGSHWEEDTNGNRDFEVGDVDTNREQFDKLAEQLAKRVDERTRKIIDDVAPTDPAVSEALEGARAALSTELAGDLRAGGLKDLTEFGRAVHAEMNALLDAGRRGVAVQDATLYTTTFPCHNCARHIVGAGIDRVVFIEPYTKSRAEQLHPDSIAIARAHRVKDKVNFVPFVGVAPRRYGEMFDAAGRQKLGHVGRKDDKTGRKQEFDKKTATPVFTDAGLAPFRPATREYRLKELLALEHFDRHRGPADAKEGEGAADAPVVTVDPSDPT
jgi:deoxycytidylate deaminase